MVSPPFCGARQVPPTQDGGCEGQELAHWVCVDPEVQALPPLLEEELLDDELEDELELLLELDELLLELELEELLELDELEELELEELEPDPPSQFPAAGPSPLIRRLSMLARPALLVASRRTRLLPAWSVTVAVDELAQVAQAPVPSKARLARLLPFTSRLAARALEPLA